MSWSLKRNDTNETIELPTDLQWVDEFQWSKIAQSAPEYSITGSMFIQQGTKKAGRPITLSGDWAWVQRNDLTILRSWCDVPKLTMTLTHPDSQTSAVMWRLHEIALDNTNPVDYQAPEEDTDPYTAAFKLMTI